MKMNTLITVCISMYKMNRTKLNREKIDRFQSHEKQILLSTLYRIYFVSTISPAFPQLHWNSTDQTQLKPNPESFILGLIQDFYIMLFG